MPRLLLSALAALVVLAAGCAPARRVVDERPELPATFPNHSAIQIVRALEAGARTVASFESRASVRVDAPEQRGSFSAVIRQRGGDSLYATVSPGLGIEAARALVTSDSFYVYDRLKNRLYVGPTSAAERVLPTAADLGRLQDNLLGLFYPDARAEWHVEVDSARYVLQGAAMDERFVIDPRIWRVLRYERRDEQGVLVEERVFSEFEPVDSVYVARDVLLRQPDRNRTVSIYHRSLSLNPESLTFPFRASSSAQRVAVD